MTYLSKKTTIPCALASAMAILPLAAHDHFAAGVLDTNANGEPDAGEPLAILGADPSTHVFHLLARPAGFRPSQKCGGYYMLDDSARTLFPNDVFSFTALSSGIEESASDGHAHAGAYIWLEITAVTGPPGARFGFWEAGRATTADTPTRSFTTGQPTGDFAFPISTGTDAEGEDPFGHIHHRAWTVDKPGDYQVSVRLVDRSTNARDGQPWHTPSQVFKLHFKAGPEFQPSMKRLQGGGCVLTWPSQMGIWEPSQTGIVFQILRSTDPAQGWSPIGSVTGTSADTVSFTDPEPPSGKAFYRLAYDWTSPESETLNLQ